MAVGAYEAEVVGLVVPLVPVDMVDLDPYGLPLPDGQESTHTALLDSPYLDQGSPKEGGPGRCTCVREPHKDGTSRLAVRRSPPLGRSPAGEVLEGESSLDRPTLQPDLHGCVQTTAEFDTHLSPARTPPDGLGKVGVFVLGAVHLRTIPTPVIVRPILRVVTPLGFEPRH